ncbi:MAG: lycopene cyclase family protein, partial [Cyanobacteria bacterium]|nr:lycopene cyclase family protein [Cyanobacteriota bacterium]
MIQGMAMGLGRLGPLTDVLVIGAGPAALAIAADLAERGLAITALAAGDPHTPWVNTYGIWCQEVDSLGLGSLLSHRWSNTVSYFGPGGSSPGGDGLLHHGRAYGLFDKAALQAHGLGRCAAADVRWLQGQAASWQLEDQAFVVTTAAGHQHRARLLLDASGHQSVFVRRRQDGPVAGQAAYGIVGRFSAPPIEPGQFVFMDSGGGLEFVSGTAMLQGVTYQGVLDMSQNNRFLRIVNGITFTGLNGAGAGTVNLTGENVNLSIDGKTTLDNATLNIGNSGGGGQSLLFANDVGPGAVLTLGSKFNVVHAGRSASLSSSGNPANAIVNQGLLTAAFSGGILNINGNRFTNTGTVLVSNSDSLVIGATTITNTGTINIAAKSSLTLSGAWSNAGKISMTDGGLGLNGSFNTAALNSITRSGGGVSIGGSEDNTGATIKVGAGAALGTIFLTTNGIISGGTIQDSGGGLEFVSGTAMLQGVTYQGVLDMSQNNRFLRIVNGI